MSLPVYTGDVSGVCSALFELGGMVVIHDPSGCNSTYNTHDEVRWYDQDSLIFITGLTERQAILGADDRFTDDVVAAATEFQPHFVALANSPIPYITGCDFHALAKIIERRCQIPCFYVPTNGMHDYVAGASAAFREVARRFVEERAIVPGTANVLGVTPLDFACGPTAGELCAFVKDAGFDVISCWAMGSSIDEVRRSAAAEVNLVVSATGLAAARVLKERFGTPYVVGLPLGGFAYTLASSMRRAAATRASDLICQHMRTQGLESDTYAVGEVVWGASYASAHELAGKGPVRLVVPVEADPGLLGPDDLTCTGEEDLAELLATARVVVADPLYAPVIPPCATLVPHPHFAFSGRAALSTR